MTLHSSICLSHNRPNQFSEQTHANLRGESTVLCDDSTHWPCSPHGLLGTHNDEEGIAVVVGVGFVVAADQVTVGKDHDGFCVARKIPTVVESTVSRNEVNFFQMDTG